MNPLTPLVQWPGGKRKLVDKIVELLEVPDTEPVMEPFAGGAALFFSRRVPSVLADANEDLRNLYRVVANNPRAMIQALTSLPPVVEKSAYYKARDTFNRRTLPDAGRAAYFLWLNRAGYNGLVRYNRAGGYNVPCGTEGKAVGIDYALVLAASELLSKSLVLDGYEKVGAHSWNYVYLDPPYQPAPGKKAFTAYSGVAWDVSDLESLTRRVQTWRRHSPRARILASDLITPDTERLWSAAGAKLVAELDVRRPINRDADGRGPVREGMWLLGPS